MTSKVFCFLIPGVEVQDGISHRAAKAGANDDEGVSRLHVGDHAILVIPGKLAYGPKGIPDVIPPDSTLIFIIEVVGVK